MPWQILDAMQQRLEVIQRLQRGESIASLSREYGVSRPTIYLWQSRFQSAPGIESLRDRSRKPLTSPGRTAACVEERVVAMRRQTGWGARKIAWRLGLCVSTTHRILARHALIGHVPLQRPATRRYQRSRPNELWQMDFKGPLGGCGDCQPLSLIDDHSRYALGLWDLPDHRGGTVQRALLEVFERCGLPEELLVDHGTPWWSTTNLLGLTWLSVWLLRQGIRLRYSGIGHPQTQGKVERFHRSLEDEWMRSGRQPSASRRERQQMLDRWRAEYNERRPHEALAMATPSSSWEPSARRLPTDPPEWCYEGSALVLAVNPAGAVRFGGQLYFVSESLRGERVQVLEVGRQLLWVRYRHYIVREIDLLSRRSTPLFIDEKLDREGGHVASDVPGHHKV